MTFWQWLILGLVSAWILWEAGTWFWTFFSNRRL